jgi:hypothetical protein
MKKLLSLAVLGLSIIWTASAQLPVNNQVIYVPSAPSGACPASPPIEVVISTGVIYSCDNGTWSVSPAGTIANNTTGTAAGLTAGSQLTLSAPSMAIANLATGPAITQGGTPGTARYVYGVVARNTAGTIYTALSPLALTTTGPATVNGTNYNIVTFPTLPTNANCFDVYVMVRLGTVYSQGLLASCQTTSYNDVGGAASGVPPFYASWVPQTTGLPAGCLQYPCTVAAGLISGLTVITGANGGYVPLYATPSGLTGQYEMCGDATMTTAGTGSLIPYGYAYWLGHWHAAQMGAATTATGTNDIGMDGSSGASNCKQISADASTLISAYTSGTLAGGGVYTWQFSLIRLK